MLLRAAAVILAAVLLVAAVPSLAAPGTAPVSSSAHNVAPMSSSAPATPHPLPAPVESPDDSFGDSDLMRGRWAMGAAFSVGGLPAPGLGPSAAIGFQWRRFGMAVEGRVLLTPDFTVGPDHSAWAMLPSGILSLCYQMGRLPRPLYTLEFCPIVGAGRLFVQISNNENQPDYFASQAHPFQLMTGVRFPVVWQLSHDNAPETYLRTFLEGNIGLIRNHISFNNSTLWDPFPQLGLTLGVEASIVVKQPRKWAKPDPDPPVATEAQSERRYW